MTAHVTVIDTTLRREKVRVGPATYMADVLEEVCNKWHISTDNHTLKSGKKTIDLSLRFRETDLTTGAKLELITTSRSPSVIQVALDLPDPEASKALQKRHIRPFASDTTFWRIIREYEVSIGGNLNLTARGVPCIDSGKTNHTDKIYYEMPVLNVMGRELSSFTALQKSLAQLGYRNGSVSIKLLFKVTDRALDEALVEIGDYFKTSESSAREIENDPTYPEEAISSQPINTSEISSTITATSTKQTESETMDTKVADVAQEVAPSPQAANHIATQAVFAPDGRETTVIAAPSGDTPRAALLPHNEDELQPTIAHLRSYQARLQRKSQNNRLPSYAEEEAVAEAQSAKLYSTAPINVKVCLPDQQKLIAKFLSNETGASLYDYVRSCVVASAQDFYLIYTTPNGPYTIPTAKKLIENPAFSRNMVVNFNWADNSYAKNYRGNVLKDELVSQAQEPKVEEPELVETEVAHQSVVALKNDEKGGKKMGGGVPKWLKLKK